MNEHRCRTCRHWRPLFSGEAWGVRSFVDAAEAERERILEILRERFAKGEGADLDWSEGDDEWAPLGAFGANGHPVPGGPTWPEWGECERTDMNSRLGDKPDRTSLAVAVDGSYYMAVLRCHADFGCVQWQEVPAAPGGGDAP